MKYTLPVLIILLSIASLHVNSQNAEAWQSVENLVGEKITNFQGSTLKNESFNLEYYKGKSIMLLFWSRYCGGCNKELPDLNKIVEQMQNSSFVLISVIDESEQLLRDSTSRFSMLDQKNGFYRYKEPIFLNGKIDFEIVVNGIEIRKQLGLPSGFPITLFIDENMIIRGENQAYYMYNNLEILTQKVDYLMAKNWSTPFEMSMSQPVIVIRPE